MEDLTRNQMEGRHSRRSVVSTGAKIAYAAPMVAATFALDAHGSLAAICPPGYTLIPGAPADHNCCICDCTTADTTLDPVTVTCNSPKFGDVTDICLTCVGATQSPPV
jgi:hypothetical protein